MRVKKKETEPVIYKSSFANLMVGFDGVARESKNGILPFKPEHFKDGDLMLYPERDYGNRRGLGREIIQRMDLHPENRANGGNRFYKLDQNAKDIIEIQDGKLIAREPAGGITKAIETQLGELHKVMLEGYDKNAHEILVDEIGVVFDTFSIKGILKPEKGHDQMRIRARLTEFFAVLEEREIWVPKKTEKEVSTSEAKKETTVSDKAKK